jgi:hypothetical protein
MPVQRHFQFLRWYLDLLAVEVSKNALTPGAGLFSVRETRDTTITWHGERLPFAEAYKRFRERAVDMGREAGLEWSVK